MATNIIVIYKTFLNFTKINKNSASSMKRYDLRRKEGQDVVLHLNALTSVFMVTFPFCMITIRIYVPVYNETPTMYSICTAHYLMVLTNSTKLARLKTHVYFYVPI